MLAIVAVFLLAALAYIAIGKFTASRERRNARMIALTLTEYFRKSGVSVSVACVAVPGTRHFTAFIESEPMKRFRLSHIIEMTLREQVHKTCGLQLANVYWRFPVKEVVHASAAAVSVSSASRSDAGAATEHGKAAEHTDDYINEGLVNYRDLPQFEVTEIPWEAFQQAATIESAKNQKTE